MTPGIVILKGPRQWVFLMSEVPLCMTHALPLSSGEGTTSMGFKTFVPKPAEVKARIQP